MKTNWQTDRGQLNHNWLQNSVLVALNHALRVADGKISSRNLYQTMYEDIVRWQERSCEIPELITRFNEEMSPKVFFEHEPLHRCAREIRSWLVPLIHELWVRREKVSEKIKTAMASYDTAEQAYKNLHSRIKDLSQEQAEEDLVVIRQILNDFIHACEKLSLSISNFPQKIRCV